MELKTCSGESAIALKRKRAQSDEDDSSNESNSNEDCQYEPPLPKVRLFATKEEEPLVDEVTNGDEGEENAEDIEDDDDDDGDFADDCEPEERDMDKISLTLECKDLWLKFHELGTEMIITKAGRRMFPVVRVRVSGLDLQKQYLVALDVEPVDDMRYRYAYHRSNWLVAGKADPQPVKRLYLHPDCPFSGEQLLNQVISFEKVKLTNNEMDHSSHIILNSMHKYQPRVLIIRKPEDWDGTCDKLTLSPKYKRTFSFPETVFIAVTAYQNQLITKLKINSNPFAKGFRDSSRFVSVERPQKISSYMSCRCSSGSSYHCPHNRSYPGLDEKDTFTTYPLIGQGQSTLDMMLKPGQYPPLSPDGITIPAYPAYIPQPMPQAFDYAYHKSLPHSAVDWHQYSQQQQQVPSTSQLDAYSSSPAVSTYLSAVSNIWSSPNGTNPSHYQSRYHHIK
ncbi:T-box protein 12-like [Rhopilema esculentum]|uniref:T-box protein 12-like n=1 Tax=Rhopilema esculentum TaxID=499914 RepID=UPI0031CF69B0